MQKIEAFRRYIKTLLVCVMSRLPPALWPVSTWIANHLWPGFKES